MEFSCTARQTGQQTILTVAGDIDLATWKQFQSEASNWTAEPADLVLDCSGVTFIDSMGITVLVQLRKQVTEAGRQLFLVDTSGRVLQVLKLAGMNQLFDHTMIPTHPDTMNAADSPTAETAD